MFDLQPGRLRDSEMTSELKLGVEILDKTAEVSVANQLRVTCREADEARE